MAFVEKQYLPIALLSALALGAANPAPGLAAAKMHIPALATFGIFIVQVRVQGCVICSACRKNGFPARCSGTAWWTYSVHYTALPNPPPPVELYRKLVVMRQLNCCL
jgi:hypothetical protein